MKSRKSDSSLTADRKATEEPHESDHSKQFLQSLLDSLSAHIAVLDESGCILAVNNAWQRFADANGLVGKNGAVGSNYLEVCEQSVGALQGGDGKIPVQGIREVIAGQREIFEMDYPCHTPTERQWYLMRVTRFNDPGPARVVVAHENITERKLAEETLLETAKQLRLVTDHVPAMIVYCDADRRFRFVNKSYAERYGVKVEDIIGRQVVEIAGQSAYAHFGKYVDRTLAGETVEFEIEVPYEQFGERIIHGICVPDLNAQGRVRGFIAVINDVTEQRGTERMVAEWKNRYEAAIMASGQILYDWNTKTNELTYGGAVEKTLGYAPDELNGGLKEWIELVHPEDRASFEQEIRRVTDTQGIFNLTYRVRRKDGAYITVEDTGHFFQDSQGRAVRMIGFVANVTERKQAEEANAYLAAIVGSSEDAIIGRTLDGIITSWNRGAEQVFGYTAQEAIGQQLAMLIPEDRRNEEYEILDQLRQGQRVEHFVTKRVTRTGQVIDVSVSTSPIRDSSGKLIGASAVSRDITARQRAEAEVRRNEERLRLAVDAAHLGTWDWDITNNHLIWGGYHGQLFGLPDQTEVSYSDFLNIVHPDDRPLLTQATARAIKDSEEYNLDFRIITPEGNVRWMHDQGFVYRNEQGKAVRMIGVVQDVTASKRAEVERELRLMQERELREVAEAASRSKDEFLAVISHELRSPLNAMLGWTRVLQGRLNDTETLAHGLDVIERSARSQQRLIEDLLDTARIISGKLRLETGPVDLITVINNALEVVRPAADARHIELSCVFDNRADLITGDADRLQQVVWNLLSNAIKFTPENGRVELKLERVDPYAQITVSDTGQGINQEFLPHIFNRFHQADSSSTRRHGGLGLGLALVRHLVELHGGTVSVKSEGLGKGAVFSVKLPLRAIRVRANEFGKAIERNTTSEMVNSPSPQMTLSGLRVLVIDDNDDAREMVSILLGQLGADVSVTESAQEAYLRMFSNDAPQFDVLISDLSMPEMDGYEFIKQVRLTEREKNWNQTPAIALTAFGRPEDNLQALLAGFQTHLTKPVELSELAIVITTLTGRAGQGMNA